MRHLVVLEAELAQALEDPRDAQIVMRMHVKIPKPAQMSHRCLETLTHCFSNSGSRSTRPES